MMERPVPGFVVSSFSEKLASLSAAEPHTFDVRDLNPAEQFAMRMVRTFVTCALEGNATMDKFQGPLGLVRFEEVEACHDFLRSIAKGNRNVRFARIEDYRMTHDEVGLVELLRSAQYRLKHAFQAQAVWIMGQSLLHDLGETAEALMDILWERGLAFRPPYPTRQKHRKHVAR